MGQKIEVQLTCDLHDKETPAVETVAFGVDGYAYEFELCNKHLDEFHKAMSGYVAAARRAGPPRRGRAAAGGARGGRRSDPGELAVVRDWARANGWKVSDRGRIAAEVREAYDAANK